MKMMFAAMVFIAATVISSVADAALLGLTNTGTGGSIGAGLGQWQMTGPGTLQTTTPNNNWGTMGPDSNWFSNVANANNQTSAPSTLFKFTTSFNPFVGTPGAVSVSLAFDALYDNSMVVKLINSNNMAGVTIFDSMGQSRFGLPATSVTVASNLIVLNGVNTLSFEVFNDPNLSTSQNAINPVGLNVLFTQQSASAIPEPATVSLWAGLAGLGVVLRRMRRRA